MLGLLFGIVLGVIGKVVYDMFREQELPESAINVALN